MKKIILILILIPLFLPSGLSAQTPVPTPTQIPRITGFCKMPPACETLCKSSHSLETKYKRCIQIRGKSPCEELESTYREASTKYKVCKMTSRNG